MKTAAYSVLLYYITDRKQFSGGQSEQRRRLLDKISEAAQQGVHYIQLREKDLTTHELELLARDVVHALRTDNGKSKTKLLINSRTDVALAVGADGVHLRADDVSPEDARSIWSCSPERQTGALVAVSCHSEAEVKAAASSGADFCVFGPVFEKKNMLPAGVVGLQKASRHSVPVLALGGVTVENAQVCLSAGAAGIAGIRLFQENDLSQLIAKLRALHATSDRI